MDPPPRVEVRNVIFAFNRGAARRAVRCVIVIVHEAGGGGGGGGGKEKPPAPVRCEGRCRGLLSPPLPPLGGIDARYEVIETELLRLELKGAPPVPIGGLEIPLGGGLNPVPRDAPQLRGSNPPAGCGVHAPSGGPPSLRCGGFAPLGGQVDSFFDVFYQVDLGGGPLRGNYLDAAGNPIGSFEAARGLIRPQPPPPVFGAGTISPTGTPGLFNFDVGFNTNLEQFIVSLPNPHQVVQAQSVAPPGFVCDVQTYPPGSHANNAYVCNGPVQAMGNHAGQLAVNPPNLPPGSKLYGAAGGTAYGPFNMNGP